MMRRSSRLFEIIQILRSARGSIPARGLATTLEVNKRTVYRDIAALQAMRVPIEGEAGVGYIMRPGFDLPPLMFTADEIEAVVVGLSLIGRTGDTGLQAAASCVRTKLAAILPGRSRAVDGQALHVSRWSAVAPVQVDHRVLREAIRNERKLRFGYRDAEERDSTRTICPIALVYYVDSVVLAGWCELRADYRHFRLDRMTGCVATEAWFKGKGAELWSAWSAKMASVLHP